MKILVTGTAEFIGFYLTKYLLNRGDTVVGLDNINNYYDVNLKYSRLKETGIEKDKIKYGEICSSNKYDNYSFIKLNIEDRGNLEKLFKQEKFDIVYNLAVGTDIVSSSITLDLIHLLYFTVVSCFNFKRQLCWHRGALLSFTL